MKKIWFRISKVLLIIGIYSLFFYLSVGDYHVPLGTGFEIQGEKTIVEEYDWKGEVSSQYTIASSHLDDSIKPHVLPQRFKQVFAGMVLIALIPFQIAYEVIGERFFPRSRPYINRFWHVVLSIVGLCIYVAAVIFLVTKYQEHIAESEAYLKTLEPYLMKK
ncbi:hypothetical protein CEH05_08490 [Halobacillus halophilus]|uniref:Uncharacterized protein n=1 Tax=Halobacillus halophilus (strain ATCC 35676 / DSM 2266 / JCM 20832 / KCTC 3685 / LMG 17431 / NBRC 102448 / NCIMB 2269) TaxID=866895 RepID=I0JLM6_HALH3|nr:hypothetical protein [Halobacillus halophilus]ASF39153.1 hypothetical protein CEH05_08490 [Halobacillus halophilus]CCG45046.1 hypothetical protein HBHAL_2696 [Halobacillus halophilus DSM 2266]